ncbi:SDR family oxidoreductase [Rhodoblastus sp.]|uniref:SDR family oxidoreductase n=1 Tax=Rhodoblastus sp. TaxID=1962975 RepID=UPI0025F89A32|nr:SDR family oxidoreductase [Rhodoblastus sp.]
MKLFIFGLGYTAGFYAAQAVAHFDQVTGTTRAPQGEAIGRVRMLPFDGAAEAVDARLRRALQEADALLVSAGPDAMGDPVLRRLEAEIAAAPRLKKIVYLSTIGVYGDHGGHWIDESAEARPSNARSRTRLEVEAQWLALGARAGKPVYVLRLSGIYGPGRNVLVKLREGTAKRLVKPGQVFNRIHVADIASAIDACLLSDTPAGIYNVTDDEPAPPQDVVLYAAILLGVAPPPEQDFVAAELTPMARSFYGENKRVSNMRMKADLGVELAFPTFREGIAALAAQGEGR